MRAAVSVLYDSSSGFPDPAETALVGKDDIIGEHASWEVHDFRFKNNRRPYALRR